MSFTETEIEEFKTEARELLETAERGLLALDSGNDFKSTFDSIFRSFHNLKGGAGMMEFAALQAHTHELESIFMTFKAATSLPKAHVNMFLRGIDAARALLDGKDATLNYDVDAAVETPTERPAPTLPVTDTEFLVECEEILERIAKHVQVIEEGKLDKDTVNALYRDVHSLKGAAHLFSFRSLAAFAHAIESSLEPVRDEVHQPTSQLIDLIFKCIKGIELEMQWIKNGQGDSQFALVQNTLPHEIEVVMRSYNTTEAKPVKENSQPAPQAPASTAPAQKEVEPEAASSIRVPVAILDKLMALMGEMVLVRNQVLQFSNRSEDLEFVNLSKRLNLVTSEVQGELLKTRMQPIGNVLSKFNRVVRDLSHELNKDISLVLHGAETELDKSLLEAIKDPLTHIVRNSCDHGIETPEVRLQNGKPAGGTITIRSFHEGGQIVAEIADDGKGLNREVLTRKAVEKGLLTEAQALALSEKEAFHLIFAPGFSTAQSITNISGRGVGMDVVRTNIERIGGTVELHSVSGHGTTVRIKLPLTLAIIPALLVNSGGSIFAIPQVKLIELVRVDHSPENKLEFLHGAPVYRLRGEILPLLDLNKTLRFNQERPKDAGVNIVVLSSDQGSFGLIVDEVQDTADIVVKPLNRLLKSLQLYSGATVLGDGTVALILDITGLAKVTQVGSMKRKPATDAAKISRENQDYISVRLNTPTKHALVLHLVHRLEEFNENQVELQGINRIIRYNDTILPLISVNKELGYGEPADKPARFPVVVVQRAGQLFGLVVDEILDTLSTNIEAQPSLLKHDGIYGSLNTPEELIVVADPYEIVTRAFPAQQTVRANATMTTAKAPAPGQRSKILLLDDAPFFRRAVARILSGAGFEVVTANDGMEGIELLRKLGDQVALVVSDIEMPRMNGFQFAQAMRQEARFADVPLIAVSSRADQDYVQRGLSAGFNIYLEKLNGDTLLQALADLGLKKGYVA